jgi:hypothetical protein
MAQKSQRSVLHIKMQYKVCSGSGVKKEQQHLVEA